MTPKRPILNMHNS